MKNLYLVDIIHLIVHFTKRDLNEINFDYYSHYLHFPQNMALKFWITSLEALPLFVQLHENLSSIISKNAFLLRNFPLEYPVILSIGLTNSD